MITMSVGEYLVECGYANCMASLAEELDITIYQADLLVSGKLNVTAELAMKLETSFDRSAESWLAMHTSHELAKARKAKRESVLKLASMVPSLSDTELLVVEASIIGEQRKRLGNPVAVVPSSHLLGDDDD